MKMSLIEFKNHFSNKVTLVFQYDNKKYIINGCQIFLEENKEKVFYKYGVLNEYISNVNEALQKLDRNVSTEDLIYIIKLYPSFIKYIHAEHQTYEMAMIAINYRWDNIMYIDPNLQDYKMAKHAINFSGYNLKFVREDLHSIGLFFTVLDTFIRDGIMYRDIKFLMKNIKNKFVKSIDFMN